MVYETRVMYLRLSLFHCDIAVVLWNYSQMNLPRNIAKSAQKRMLEASCLPMLSFPEQSSNCRLLDQQSNWKPTQGSGRATNTAAGGTEAKSKKWKSSRGRRDTSGKMAPLTCREYPFSVLPCPIVIFLRNRSLVSNTEREQVGYSINKYGLAMLGDAEEGAENKSQGLASFEELNE